MSQLDVACESRSRTQGFGLSSWKDVLDFCAEGWRRGRLEGAGVEEGSEPVLGRLLYCLVFPTGVWVLHSGRESGEEE